MIQVGNKIVSFKIFDSYFLCDIIKCKGACCIEGDSGAPLENEEKNILDNIFEKVKPYMQSEGIKAVEENGTSVLDSDGDWVTPLIDGKECAYTYFENGIAKCAIEKAWLHKKIDFQKPVSCHLYPIRVTNYPTFQAVNYHEWKICNCAVHKGNNEKLPVFVFLKQALIRKYGQDWYKELEVAADLYYKSL